MREPSPSVSVCLAVHNGADFIAECIESILAQTFTDFEFLILDDGSTDHTKAVVERYAQQDARIVFVSRPNAGVCASRNQLLANAKGRYVAVMDHDDIAMPERFALQVAYLESHADVVCVGGDTYLIDAKGRLLHHLKHLKGDAAIQASILEGHGALTHPAAMIRTQAMRDVGGYDPRYLRGQDLDLWLRLGEVGKLENLDTPVLKYRLHGASASEKKGQEQRANALNACERAWARRGIQGKFTADFAWRPSSDKQSKHKFALQYGWWAWNMRERNTAAIYALKAIKTNPFNAKGWALLACAYLRQPPS